MDIPRPNISKQEIKLPLLARLVLFALWPLIMVFVAVFILAIMALVWLILPFKASITLKN